MECILFLWHKHSYHNCPKPHLDPAHMVPHHCKLNKSYPPSRHYTKHGGANRTFYLSRVYGYGRACSSLWDAIEACVGTQRACTRSAAKTCWHMPSPVHPRAYPKARKESRRPMNQKETGGMFHGIRLVTYEPSLPDRPHRCQGSQPASGPTRKRCTS